MLVFLPVQHLERPLTKRSHSQATLGLSQERALNPGREVHRDRNLFLDRKAMAITTAVTCIDPKVSEATTKMNNASDGAKRRKGNNNSVPKMTAGIPYQRSRKRKTFARLRGNRHPERPFIVVKETTTGSEMRTDAAPAGLTGLIATAYEAAVVARAVAVIQWCQKMMMVLQLLMIN